MLSPLLFITFLDDIVKWLNSRLRLSSIQEYKYDALAYADDLLIIAPDKSYAGIAGQYIYMACSQYGISVNIDKTKIKHMSGRRGNNGKARISPSAAAAAARRREDIITRLTMVRMKRNRRARREAGARRCCMVELL